MEVGPVYTAFRQSLLNYISSRIRSKEDAKDILHNVFAKISSNIHSLSEKNNLQHWLFTVTKNAIIDYYRVNASRDSIRLDESTVGDIIQDEYLDNTKGLDKCVSQMIELLPENYKNIVRDSEIAGIKQKDLAKKYNTPYSSLRSRVQRGRERLKELLYECCHIETDTRGNVLEVRSKNGCAKPCNPCAEE